MELKAPLRLSAWLALALAICNVLLVGAGPVQSARSAGCVGCAAQVNDTWLISYIVQLRTSPAELLFIFAVFQLCLW